MAEYEPELGQLIFGQPHQEYEVSEYVEAVLAMLDREMERVWFNTHGHNDPYSSPFRNTSASYVTDTFEAHAYSWTDDEQEYNFKWRDVRISWYKYLGRGMSANVKIPPDLGAEMLDDCLRAVRKLETEE